MKVRYATITKAAEGEGKFNRRSEGRAHYGHVMVKVEPNGRGMGVAVVRDAGGVAIPEKYLKAVADGVREALSDGAVPGCSVVDIVVRVVGGSSHETDSSDIDFKLAAIFAMKDAIKKSAPAEIE